MILILSVIAKPNKYTQFSRFTPQPLFLDFHLSVQLLLLEFYLILQLLLLKEKEGNILINNNIAPLLKERGRG